jgi:hypothetical protein
VKSAYSQIWLNIGTFFRVRQKHVSNTRISASGRTSVIQRLVMSTNWLNTCALALVVAAVALLGFKNLKGDKGHPILNVSYDPTRELYTEINAKFIAKYEEDTGSWVGVEQSHGGSARQARPVQLTQPHPGNDP